MKWLALGIMAISASAVAQDFRDVDWGASRVEVQAAETAEAVGDEGNRLYFEGDVAGITTGIVYEFLPDDRLATAYYVFSNDYTNRNTYITDYDNVKEILTRVYGDPELDTTDWKDDLYQDDPSEYGFAVSLGHLVYTSSYTTETTNIIHILGGNNYDISHLVQYTSLELGGEADQLDQQSEDDAF